MNTTNVMAIWKEFNPKASKSMREDFKNESSPHRDKIIKYLNNGKVELVACSCASDVFSGVRIPASHCILTDGEYLWSSTLAYYVKEYNLQIPKEFEEKIVKL